MRRAIVLLMLANFSITSGAILAGDEKPDNERLRELLVERRDTLREAVEEYEKAIRADESVSFDAWLRAAEKLRNAELELCRTPLEQLAAWERLLAQAMAVEREIGRRYRDEAIGGTAANYAAVRGARLSAEIGLIRARSAVSAELKKDGPNWDPVVEPTDKLLRVLMKSRRDVLRQRVKATVTEASIGSKAIEEVIDARNELLDAELELTDDPQERSRLHHRHLQRMVRHDREQEARAELILSAPEDIRRRVFYMHAARLAAEINLRAVIADVKSSLVKYDSDKSLKELEVEHSKTVEEFTKQVRQNLANGLWLLLDDFEVFKEELQLKLRSESTHAGRMRLHEQHVAEFRQFEEQYKPWPAEKGKILARGDALFVKAARLEAEIDELRERMRGERDQQRQPQSKSKE